MENKNLWALVNNTIESKKERSELLNEISNSPELKQELALYLKIKELGRKKTIDLLERQKKKKSDPSAWAKSSLSEIRHAAFGKNKHNDELTSLPVNDQTLDDFLNEEDENDL